MASHLLQLIHGGFVVRIFLKKLWHILSAKPATSKQWAEDEYQGRDVHLDNW